MTMTSTIRHRSDAAVLHSRAIMIVAPVLALIYPFALKAFNLAVTALDTAKGSVVLALTAALTLLLPFLLTVATVMMALRFAGLEKPTIAQLRAKRIAIVAVAAPTIFVFAGVLLYMAGDPINETGLWVAFWGAAIAFVALANNKVAAVQVVKPIPPALRVAHGVAALAVVIIFLGFHLSNHLVGLAGGEAHTAFIKVVRLVYRAPIVEPVLVALFFFLAGSGLYFALRYMAAPMDRFRAFQVASGVYLAFYVIGHMDSVFIFARTFLGIDSDWAFATGAPAGLIKDPWNIRLIPHYALAVFFVLAHLASGLRIILLAHGWRKGLADRLMIGGAVAGGVVATIIILAMCGMRLHFV